MRPVVQKVIGEEINLLFTCPACAMLHGVFVGKPNSWRWNGDELKPTIEPSILVTGVLDPTEAESEAWSRSRVLWTPRPFRCHSFVREGMIEFLGDCTHRMANQTAALPEVES